MVANVQGETLLKDGGSLLKVEGFKKVGEEETEEDTRASTNKLTESSMLKMKPKISLKIISAEAR